MLRVNLRQSSGRHMGPIGTFPKARMPDQFVFNNIFTPKPREEFVLHEFEFRLDVRKGSLSMIADISRFTPNWSIADMW